MRRAWAAGIVTVVALAGAAAGDARAKPGQFTTFEAPTELINGGDAARAQTLDELQGLGVTALRMTIFWQSVAPSAGARHRPRFDQADPAAYDWGAYGALADAARARGMRLLVSVSGPVPRWATAGGRDHLTNPSPADFKQFMTAVGRRFGAETYAFSIWNEPNLAKFLAPQWDRHGRLLSPTLYRRLFFAGYHGLRLAGVSAPVLAGELEPVGNAIAVAPMRFLRGVLCLDSRYRPLGRCGRLPASGWAIHPYMRPRFPTTPPPGPDDVTIGGLRRLEHGLDLAARSGMVARRLPVYATEFGVQSYPNRVAGVPLALQSDYRSVAEYLAWSDPRVASFSQYLLTDPAPLPGPAIGRYIFQMGLYLYAGHRRKPAYDSFRLPLVVRRRGRAVSLWGLVRPAAAGRRGGTVSVEIRDSGRGARWRRLLSAPVRPDGHWTARARDRAGRRWRVVYLDPTGRRFTGPATASYAF
jgi:hypothetical protein